MLNSKMLKVKTLLPILRKVKVKTVEKGEIIIPSSSDEKVMYYVRKGLIRSFIENKEEDTEITFQFFPENTFFTNVDSVLFNSESSFVYESLERTKLYMLDLASFVEVISKEPYNFYEQKMFFSRNFITRLYNRTKSFVFLSPLERYEEFLKEYPTVVNRAPDKYIANVLGITPTSLSRIRGRIATRKS